MKVGETAYIAPSALNVDFSGGCWIRCKAILSHEDIPGMVTVRREGDGYHLAIEEQQYTADDPLPQQEVRAVSVTFRRANGR
jgi:hypothetical protein